MILNIHRKKTPNRGDLASSFIPYVDSDINLKSIDVLECNGESEHANNLMQEAEVIVYGGGGLIDNIKFNEAIKFILSKFGNKTVVWGAGSNFVKSKPFKEDLSLAHSIAIRDYRDPFERSYDWVPCVSCMSTSIDDVMQAKDQYYVGGIGILKNNSGANIHEIGDCGYNDIRHFGNKKVSIEEMLKFIISCETLVTTSFHASYWATLMGVPVVSVPTSSKFYSFKHQPPIASKNNWNEFLDKTQIFPAALDECRMANTSYLRSLRKAFPAFEKLTFKNEI